MAGSLNRATLLGNLGRDPESRALQDGTKVVTLSLATSETWTDKHSGEKKERTEWHRVVIFNERIAETADKYLKKGSKALVEGQIQTRKWTDQGGQERYTTEIVIGRFSGQLLLLGDGRAGPPPASGADEYGRAGAGAGAPRPSGGGGVGSELDDDIPF
jgi:single-strand DNA-binding protein